MKKDKVTVKVTFRQGRNRDGLRLSAIKGCDNEALRIELMSLLPLVGDNPNRVKVRHSAGFIVSNKIKSLIMRLGYVFKSLRTACSKDFEAVKNA